MGVVGWEGMGGADSLNTEPTLRYSTILYIEYTTAIIRRIIKPSSNLYYNI